MSRSGLVFNRLVSASTFALRSLLLLPPLLLGVTVGACTDKLGGDCSPGTGGCECLNGQCAAGYVCSAGVCTDFGNTTNTTFTTLTTSGEDDTSGEGCGEAEFECNGECVDVLNDPDNCGGCGTACTDGQACSIGICVADVDDCTQEPCPGFTYCDLATMQCMDGCASDDQCGDLVCDIGSHDCVCPAGTQECNGGCIPEGDPCGGGPDSCGWFEDPSLPGYYCGGMGSDPSGVNPLNCPPGLVEGDACGSITGVGCCDANGDNWYCAEDGQGNQLLVLESCA